MPLPPSPLPPSPVHSRTVIEARPGWFQFEFREIWRFRYLIGLYVYRDFVVHYKQTILGPAWWLIQPLLTTFIFTLIFSRVANISTDGLPALLFYFSGITLWNYFQNCVLHVSNTFLDNREVFQKVYFPRLIVPIAAILNNLMRLVLQLLLFIPLYLFYFLILGERIQPTWLLWGFPLLVLYVAALAFGIGTWVASLTTKYRDLALVLPFFLQLGMFASAVIVPLSLVSPKMKPWFYFNPMVSAVESFRIMCFGSGTLSFFGVSFGVATTVFLLFTGVLLFNRVGKSVADTI